MANKYRWNKEELLREKDLLILRKQSHSNTISNYNEMISIIDGNPLSDLDKLPVNEYDPFSKLDFTSKLKKELKIYKKNRNNHELLEYLHSMTQEILCFPAFVRTKQEHHYLTETDLISLSQNLFKDLDSEYYQKISEITNRHHAIHFKKHNQLLDYNGTCFFIPELKKPYILVTRGHTLFDFSSLNHELMHGAEFLLNNGVDQNPKHVLIDEIGSLYLEFVTTAFLIKEGISANEIKPIRQTNYQSNIVDSFNEFSIRYNIMEFLKDNYKHIADITINDINIMLKLKKINIDNAEEYIVGNVAEGVAYGISYMLANTIYHNYDKKKQLAILKEVNENPVNPFVTLEKHNVPITKTPHIENLKIYAKTLH